MSARMNPMKSLSQTFRASRIAVLAGLALLGMNAANAQVSQTPLSAGRTVPGNLFLVPSVEWPTLDSMANIEPNYDPRRTFPGYFDPDKCYRYNYSLTEGDRYFYPNGPAAGHTCSIANVEWSGNFLNWAATQTIDPFRKALTGGYRVRDTTTETWLEKARSDGNTGAGIYPDRNLGSLALVSGAMPSDWTSVVTRVRTFGNKMRFRGPGVAAPGITADVNGVAIAYDPSIHTLTGASANIVFEVSVRVAVCVPSFEETNCVRYTGGVAKPEGLIQEYSRRIRFSAFGFLNDHGALRDGGVLRARQKFVGPQKLDPATQLWVANTNAEWNATTGIINNNPDATDASATAAIVGTTTGLYSYRPGTTTLQSRTIGRSGVINYINRFGQMTSINHKSFDPVSELYYTALRYMRGMDNIPAYTNMSGSSDDMYNLADGFPVITDWDGPSNNDDPIQYRCQKNAFLGIGDTNSHKDKNLPGHRAHSGYVDQEPTTEPVDDTLLPADAIDVYVATQKVATNEGIGINTNSAFTGRENSAYIAGLAYHAHTKDMRSDLEGQQTVSTHWVDVRENQVLQGRASNQYWLAAKYGGFTIPPPVAPARVWDPYAATITIPQDNWTDGDVLENGNLRPRNFYVASDADKMLSSLTDAFKNIAAENVGSSASLAANSTRLDAGTRTFQAQFVSGRWSGELNSYEVQPITGALIRLDWAASQHATLDRVGNTAWAARNIKIPTAAGTQVDFRFANLTAAQTTALGSAAMVNYLRGDSSNEETPMGGIYRARSSMLGDIVNSTPVFVGRPNAGLYSGATFSGAGDYGTFAAARATRDGMVYVGANDGMLHAFNATTTATRGAETYAFIPNTVILNSLTAISDPAYTHRYYVDGDIAIADAYDGSNWRTILIGTLGRGGPGVFALDITNPASIQFLWERSGTDIAALGKNIGRPVIAQVANGDWRVLLGNGPESSTNRAALITINVFNGNFTTIQTDATVNNGLSAVLARDTDGDGFADTAYGGDMLGNLKKITGINGAGAVSTIYSTGARTQPITAAPLVGRDPATGVTWVFFGSGSYLTDDDFISTDLQSWYGVKDTGTAVTRAQLLSRDIIQTVAYSTGVDVNNPADDVLGKRVIAEGTAADLATYRGWVIDFDDQTRERMVVPNRFQGGALIGTTRIPDPRDACDPSGSGFIMAINPFTGARLDRTFFDMNGDGLFNNADQQAGNVISGVGFNSSPNAPIFVEDVMQVSLDDGTTKTIRTQGSSVAAERLNWREIIN